MFKQVPVKKEYLVIAATIVFLLICYEFAFKNTIDAWQINSQLKTKFAQSTDFSYQPGYLQRKDNNLVKIINQYKADTSDFRGNIISTISTLAEMENAKLTELPLQDVTYHTDHFIIEKLVFEGDYFSLIKVVNQLQSTNGIGVIRSETWKVTGVKSFNDDAKKLVLEIYLEIAR